MMCIDVEITGDHPVGFGVYFFSLLYRTYVLALLKDQDEFARNNVKDDKLISLDLHHSGGVLVVWWEWATKPDSASCKRGTRPARPCSPSFTKEGYHLGRGNVRCVKFQLSRSHEGTGLTERL
jgi:hypothetical protein